MGMEKGSESLNDRLVEGTLKFGGGSLMMWGCVTWELALLTRLIVG